MTGWKYKLVVPLVFVGVLGVFFLAKQNVRICQGDMATRVSEMKSTLTVTTPPVEEIATTEANYVIPQDEELQKLSDSDLMAIYWKYINRLQILCKDIIRVGSLKDGGKEICVEEPYVPKAPCLVYSFGINNQWDFDKDIVDKYECDVHCFDPSMKRPSGKIQDHIWFYRWGLGGDNTVNSKGWTIKTLDAIRKELNHTERPIDILKMDIEGDEWNSIPQMITSGALDDVRQISMETHFGSEHPSMGPNWGGLPRDEQLSALRQLYDAGYRTFMRERNMWSVHTFSGVKGFMTNVNEISLIRPPKR